MYAVCGACRAGSEAMTNRACLVLAMAGVAPLSAMGDEFWRQNPQSSAGGYSSQDARKPGGLGGFSGGADNFPGNPAGTINKRDFWGGYGANVQPNTIIHGATIRFYTDNNGHPGTRIFQ